MKKILSMFLVITLIVGLGSVCFAEDDSDLNPDFVKIASVKYRLNNGDVIEKDVYRNITIFEDATQDTEIIDGYLWDKFYSQTFVKKIISVTYTTGDKAGQEVLIEDSEFSKYSKETTLEDKINAAESSNVYTNENIGPVQEVVTDEEGNISKVVDEEETKVPEEVEVNIKLNGEVLECDVKPYIKDGRTMIPARAIFEALGATVEVDFSNPELKLVWAKKLATRIDMCIGDLSVYIDDNKKQTEVKMDVAPEIKNGRTFIPLRYASEILGADVEWVSSTKTVLITTEK